MQDKQLIEKYSAIIAEFMGWKYYDFPIWVEKSKNHREGLTPFYIKSYWLKSNKEIVLFNFKTDKFFGGNVEKCIKWKDYKNDLYIQYSFNYHTDWNEIYKAVKKIVQINMQNFTEEQLSFVADQMYLIEKCFTSYSNDNTCYDAFVIVAETIEYLNTIK